MRRPRLKILPLRLWLGPFFALVTALTLVPALHSKQQATKSSSSPTVAYKAPGLSPALDGLLRNGFALYMKHQDDSARDVLVRALAMAQEEKSSWGQGEAHRILGLIALRTAKYLEAQTELTKALALFESIPSPLRIAHVHLHLGAVANYMGKPAEAVELYRKALSEFEELRDLPSQALVLENLMFVDALPPREKDAYFERGLKLARGTGNKSLAGEFLHAMGDHLFTAGDFVGASEKLNEAAASLEEAGDRAALATVWTSIGRLYRMHGAFDDAISYYRKGLLIQQELGDKIAEIELLNAIAISYGEWGHGQEAIENYEHALSLARETGSPRVIAFMTGNVGGSYAGGENNNRAIDLLNEALRLEPVSLYSGNRYMQLGFAYQTAKQYDLALNSADQAVELLRGSNNPDILYQAFQERAHIFRDLKRFPEALADTLDAIHSVEQVRSKLVPEDYLKQGYAGRTQNLFVDAIEIYEQLGQYKEAMMVGEEARARAFLDLLASRRLEPTTPQVTGASLRAASDSPSNLASNSLASSTAKKDEPIELATRGSAPLKISQAPGPARLPSPSSAAPPTFEEFVSTAKRLDSTLLSYWVTPDTTFIWVLRPDGVVRSERAAVTSEQLSNLIRQTSYGEEEPHAEPSVEATKAKTDAPVASAAARGSQTLRLRGGGELVLGSNKTQSWRELYKLLILPVQDSLPARGSHLTIVPQGSLFRLSFAALQDAQGHYLVENYALNYAPSLGVLRLTGERRDHLGQRQPRYLIVADPLISPDQSNDSNLPPLPGARLEARNLVRLLPHGETTLLMGSNATKQALRDGAAGKTVLHLAMHAIVRDDQPLDSFLALSAGDKSTPGSGHLTVREIYGLDLQTDLVVLSACSTALGKLSGDGMAGLTRAFFYGGAPSVMATLWDVADEPTSLLISEFYRSLRDDPDKSHALRTAQLRLVRELRAGRVHVKTALGPITLPEDPAFWAGFVLQGEP